MPTDGFPHAFQKNLPLSLSSTGAAEVLFNPRVLIIAVSVEYALFHAAGGLNIGVSVVDIAQSKSETIISSRRLTSVLHCGHCTTLIAAATVIRMSMNNT